MLTGTLLLTLAVENGGGVEKNHAPDREKNLPVDYEPKQGRIDGFRCLRHIRGSPSGNVVTPLADMES